LLIPSLPDEFGWYNIRSCGKSHNSHNSQHHNNTGTLLYFWKQS
jgi:hypothetical protein